MISSLLVMSLNKCLTTCGLRHFNLNKLYSNSHFKSKRYHCILHSLRLSRILRCSTLMLCDLCTQSWLAHACQKRSISYSFSMRPHAVHQCLAQLNILTTVRVMLWLLSTIYSKCIHGKLHNSISVMFIL